jgi:hypothetical protein
LSKATRKAVASGKAKLRVREVELELRVKELEAAIAGAGDELEEEVERARQAERDVQADVGKRLRRVLGGVEAVVGLISFLYEVRAHQPSCAPCRYVELKARGAGTWP